MSNFRQILPSTSNVATADTDATASEAGQPYGGGDPSGSAAGKARRRRAPSHVSQNACTNCKKARAKCDGEEPTACTRCTSRDMAGQCHYELHVKTAKEEMVRRIKSLEQLNADLQGSINDKAHWTESVLRALLDDEQGQSAVRRLAQGRAHPQLDEWLGRAATAMAKGSPPWSDAQLSSLVSEYNRSMTTTTPAGAADAAKVSPLSWTGAVADEALTNHLLALYFTWAHPVHMLFSERHFMASFRNGDRRYCTPALVNAICAMASFFLVSPSGKQRAEPANLGASFLEQVRAYVLVEGPRAPTYASTYAIMFLVELSSGQARLAASHLRLAVESLRHIDVSSFSPEAVEITAWGVQTLNTAWAGFTYQSPAAPASPLDTVFQNIELDPADAFWRPYRFPHDPTSSETPSHAIRTARELARLSHTVNETMSVYCGSRETLTSSCILRLYQRHLSWKEMLPPDLELDDGDGPLLPHVVYLHVTYHTAICQLFRPLLECRDLPPSARHQLKAAVVRSSREGVQLLERYRNALTNRYQPPLQAFQLVHLCDAILRVGPAERDGLGQRIVVFCLEMLGEALPDFAFVGPLQAMFCQTARESGFVLPDDVDALMQGRSAYGPEELLDACERTTYRQPAGLLLGRLDAAAMARDWDAEWRVRTEVAAGVDDADAVASSSSSVSGDEGGGRGVRRASGALVDGGPGKRALMQIDRLVNPEP